MLVRSGVTVRTSKKTLETLASGRTAYVDAPNVADYEAVKRAIAKQNVAVQRIEERLVDIESLRGRLEISQEEFAGRYGLDVATVRNWEQGRTKPDRAARTLLQLIDRDPDKIVELLAS